MKKLLELEQKLIEAREELNKAKKHEDAKEDKKQIAEALDRHNEKKHGEPKDEDSAFKDMKVKKNEEMGYNVNMAKEEEKVGVSKAPTKGQSEHGPVKVTDVKSGTSKVIGSVGTTKFKKSSDEESVLVKIAENGQWSIAKAEKVDTYVENSGIRKKKPDDDKVPEPKKV